jgi:hypothetical protein
LQNLAAGEFSAPHPEQNFLPAAAEGTGTFAAALQFGQNFAPIVIGCPQLLQRTELEPAIAFPPECITAAVMASMFLETMTACRCIPTLESISPLSRNLRFDFENGRHYTPKSPAPALLRRFHPERPDRFAIPTSIAEIAPFCGLLLQHSSSPSLW